MSDKREKTFTPEISHYFYKVEAISSGRPKYTEWNWEISIAVDNNDVYYGMAIERKHNEVIHWRELTEKHDDENNYVNEIKHICYKKSEWRPEDKYE
ncbi:hypothetical protein [Bacillus mycoides]|uniref:hypothetical protein n=1 Tax=Bacillus mycoides TaxID=1405 RepID=UPI0011A498E2|nr:hypothetical protein [Bacillus mycoides]